MDLTQLVTYGLTGFLAFLIFSVIQQRLASPKRPLHFPIIGHIYLIADPDNLHFVFAKLAAKYGEVIRLNLMGVTWNLISSPDAAKLTTVGYRSNLYSPRPVSPFAEQFLFVDGQEDMAFGSNVEIWKSYKKLIHPLLSATAVKDYDRVLGSGTSSVKEILRQQGSGPFDPNNISRSFPFNVMLTILFGKIYEASDPLFVELIVLVKGILDESMVGIVTDFAPILRYLPLPTWSRLRGWIKRRDSWFRRELGDLKLRLASSHPATVESARNSFFGKLYLTMENDPTSRMSEAAVMMILHDLLLAGIDTTATSIIFFFAYMANHPHVLKKMQDELDVVVPNERDPNFEDALNLPYVNAVINEMLRVRPPAAISLPHTVLENDVLNDVLITKGSHIFYNIWYIHRHPNHWSEPIEAFDPDRFIRFAEKQKEAEASGNADAPLKDDPANLGVFGFGRRICPGQFLARRELFIFFSTVAKEFDIEKPPEVEWVEDGGRVGTTLQPLPFKIVLKERKRRV
ncbi:cytochrome P450 [Cladochytrium replicatum]|nr:cytochrome P450 [Cladochytrium replicatum]